MSARADILEGAKAAARLHGKLQIRHHVEATNGGVDIFGCVAPLEGTLIFRPLKGLLGAFLPGSNPGIMVTTERPLPIQRFTGAHELGHLYLKHQRSLDGDEILGFPNKGNPMEIQANGFAAEFLMPKWAMSFHARRQNWNRESMCNPVTVYQLSLRLGTSYEATCFALKNHAIVDVATAEKLLATQPKTIKQAILPNYKPQNWFFDVWVLTSHDEGALIEGQPNDLFLLNLSEKPGAGYLWNLDGLRAQGFAIVRDSRVTASEDEVGSPMIRAVAARTDNPSKGQVAVSLARPWLPNDRSIAEFRFNYDLFGKELGLPRVQRRLLAAAR